jgi:hypothetical protein
MKDGTFLKFRAELLTELQTVSPRWGYCSTLVYRATKGYSQRTRSLSQIEATQYLILIEEILELAHTHEAVVSTYRRGLVSELDRLRTHLLEALHVQTLEKAEAAVLQPPAKLELLLHLLMKPADADAAAGDLAQRYGHLATRLGPRKARIWYIKQIIASLWPLLRTAIHGLWRSAIGGMLGVLLRMVGLGQLADAVRAANRLASGHSTDAPRAPGQ